METSNLKKPIFWNARTRRVVVFLVTTAITGFILVFVKVTVHQISVARTHYIFSKIRWALCDILGNPFCYPYDIVRETLKVDPSLRVRDHQLLDDWGHPIAVLTKGVADGDFEVRISSSGRDAVMGTRDDVSIEMWLEKREDKP